ncbi:Hypothetical predicted protein [Cloeon dipterum]|uniref:Uncharacterized protein n=1 Tax=Cloeon dipterum TaxID=197152 RepID=A0A8S1CGY5_9INSE|nr:Hypothetical predicted protein [Cloeon dipterum]
MGDVQGLDNDKNSAETPRPKRKDPVFRRNTAGKREGATAKIQGGEKIAGDMGLKADTVTNYQEEQQREKPKRKHPRTTPEDVQRLVSLVRRQPQYFHLKDVMKQANFPCSERTAKKKLKEAGITVAVEHYLCFESTPADYVPSSVLYCSVKLADLDTTVFAASKSFYQAVGKIEGKVVSSPVSCLYALFC